MSLAGGISVPVVVLPGMESTALMSAAAVVVQGALKAVGVGDTSNLVYEIEEGAKDNEWRVTVKGFEDIASKIFRALGLYDAWLEELAAAVYMRLAQEVEKMEPLKGVRR